MRALFLFAFMGLLAVPHAGDAQSITGNSLFEACTSDNQTLAGFCIGYLIGQTEGQFWGALLFTQGAGIDLETGDFNSMANMMFQHCVPQDATNQQLRDVVVTYLTENPATRHETARSLVWEAYRAAFPC